jgi:hypothetical protein
MICEITLAFLAFVFRPFSDFAEWTMFHLLVKTGKNAVVFRNGFGIGNCIQSSTREARDFRCSITSG